MHLIFDHLGFRIGTAMRNGRRMLICDTEGGECFSYLEWDTEERALCVEAYAAQPILLEVSLGKELRGLLLARSQFILTFGLEAQLGLEPSREEAMRWIEEAGGFDRDQRGNWYVKT
jgi:hypothetical protein